LNECDKVARRSFVANQFGFQPAPLVQASYGGNYLVQPTDARRSPRLAEKEAPKVQTTLNRYMLHKEIIKQYEDVKAKTKDELKKGDPKTDNNKKKKK
jgi:hypothetical protein